MKKLDKILNEYRTDDHRLEREKYTELGLLIGSTAGLVSYLFTHDYEQTQNLIQAIGHPSAYAAGMGYCVGMMKNIYNSLFK